MKKFIFNADKEVIEVEGIPMIFTSKTLSGYRWFSNVGRAGIKTNFETPIEALKASAKTLGIKVDGL
jgi:hypothetical protein